MILLDTDTLTLLMNGHNKVKRLVSEADDIGITIVSRIEVLQERFASIMKAADSQLLIRAQTRLQESEKYIRLLTIADFEERSAGLFDELRIEKHLKKIGRADLLIACIALANRATLVTRNLKHFKQVPGLKLENWAD